MGITAEPQTTITMTCDVTKETKVVVVVKNATDTVLLKKYKEIGDLVLSRTSCLLLWWVL
jgi:hypothetical protein